VRRPADPAFTTEGAFYKGNIHTHSTRSDGARDPAAVCALYRDAGYDFLALTDHFLARWDYPIVDTTPFRTAGFTTILGAEVHAPATLLGEAWHILAVGLPADFVPPAADETAPALAWRCHAAGAFLAIAHPAWYGLTTADAAMLPMAHAVEIYNHTSQVRTDRGDSTGLVDQLLAEGRRLTVCAVDDAHLHCNDALGGFVMVKAPANTPEALLDALRNGRFYSSQGPLIETVTVTDDTVQITAAGPVSAIIALGRGSAAEQRVETGLTSASLPLARFRTGGYVRVVLVDEKGRRAWTNPVWL